jgi:cyclopropane fatty-acyl-phospholipid synthase-like methyltransferase
MIRRLFFELLYFRGKANWDSGISPPELLETLNHTTPGRALDLGCGTGTNAMTMAQYGWDVVGVDFSARAIHTARRKAKSSALEITFIRGDVIDLKGIQGSFDLILDIGCFHTLSLRSQQKYKENLKQFLRSGGTFLLYTHLKELESYASMLPSEERIRELFEDCCECESVVIGSDTASLHRSAWFKMKRNSP